MKKQVHVIYGGQFGSEAKRLFTEYYAEQFKPNIIITNALPNSGGFDSKGLKWSTLPIGYPAILMISPGSAISPENLRKEIAQLPPGARVLIHKNAAVVQDRHLKDEESFVRIGSTMTGGAAAVFEKMQRDPESNVTASAYATLYDQSWEGMIVDNDDWMSTIIDAERILCICAQGHSLSINYGFYPWCTSRNTSPAQVIADAGIPMQWVEKIIGCFRTYPIRVANRYNEEGERIGWSGPCYFDQREISWDDVGVKEEYTSVSKKVRRVFNFSYDQLAESVAFNGTTDVFLNFMNYLDDDKQVQLVDKVEELLALVGHSTGIPCKISFLGYGPTKDDIQIVQDDIL
jgi:adenylosuccinate synthase